MRILVLSFYFRPDLSAGSFRASTLVDSLLPMLPPGAAIEVITTAPNRYHTFNHEAPEVEVLGAVTVKRIALPAHRSDLWGQARAFMRFARRASRQTAHVHYDLVFATSSRLMTAALGAWIARRSRARLYLDIRDIFVDTIGDVFPSVAKVLRPPLSAVERWSMCSADRINLVSRGFEGYFRSRYPDRSYAWFSNGIDEEFRRTNWARKESSRAQRPLRVVYAGNIGEGQGLHAILPQLATALGQRASFLVIGDGGRRDLLLERLRQAGADNVEVLPPVARAELLHIYLSADVLFLHLNAYSAFEKVLPSKIFEYAAMGKPIWAGVAGYAATFIASEVSNAVVFAPCDAADAMRKLEQLVVQDQPREQFVARYARAAIGAAMAADILQVARAES